MSFQSKVAGPRIGLWASCSCAREAAPSVAPVVRSAVTATTQRSRFVSIFRGLSGEAIGCALRARQHRVGFVVVLESLVHWVPIDFALQDHGDVVDQAG